MAIKMLEYTPTRCYRSRPTACRFLKTIFKNYFQKTIFKILFYFLFSK